MTSSGKQNPTATHSPKTKAERAERLAVELRANLHKRKALSRTKAEAGKADTPDPDFADADARNPSEPEKKG